MTEIAAHAKLTVYLRLTGRRDDGYHLIDSEMVTLELADRLTFAEGDSLAIGGPFADGIPSDDSNLVRRALRAVRRSATVTIDKQIPSQGGLGGGSADAAAVLRWAGCNDLDLAAKLGADVPFCLVGGRAHVSGIGDVIVPLAPIDRAFTLVTPPLGVSTVAAYQAWDSLGGPASTGPNDLEPAALIVEPRLERWRDAMTSVAGRAPTLAGSGSTWFFTGHVFEIAEALASEGLSGASVIHTRTTRSRRCPLLIASLETGPLQHLLVLLLPHALTALLDQRTHTESARYTVPASLHNPIPALVGVVQPAGQRTLNP